MASNVMKVELEIIEWDHSETDTARAPEDKATMGVRVAGTSEVVYLHMGTPAFRALKGAIKNVTRSTDEDPTKGLDPKRFAELEQTVFAAIPVQGGRTFWGLINAVAIDSGFSRSNITAALLGLKARGKIHIDEHGGAIRRK